MPGTMQSSGDIKVKEIEPSWSLPSSTGVATHSVKGQIASILDHVASVTTTQSTFCHQSVKTATENT